VSKFAEAKRSRSYSGSNRTHKYPPFSENAAFADVLPFSFAWGQSKVEAALPASLQLEHATPCYSSTPLALLRSRI